MQFTIPSFQPLGAEIGEGAGLQNTFGQGKHQAFFLVEVIAGGGDRAEEQLFGGLQILGFLHLVQGGANQLVLVMEGSMNSSSSV